MTELEKLASEFEGEIIKLCGDDTICSACYKALRRFLFGTFAVRLLEEYGDTFALEKFKPIDQCRRIAEEGVGK